MPTRTTATLGRQWRDQRHDRPDDGRDRRGQRTSGARNRGGQEGRPRPKKKAERRRRRAFQRAAARDPGRRRAGRATAGSTRYKYDGYRLLLARRRRRRDRLDPQRQGLERQVHARSSKAAAKLPAGCLIDGEAVALDDEGKPELPAASVDAQGAEAAPTSPSTLSTCSIDRGEDITQAAQYRAQGAARRAARRVPAADPLWRPCHRPRRGAVRRDLQGGRRRASSRRRPTPPIAARARKTGSRSNASSGRNSSSSAGRKATSGRGFRSLLLGVDEKGKLPYAGKVGTGFNARLIEDLRERMEPLETDKAAGRGAARRMRGARIGSSRSSSPRSPSPSSPPTACCATRASSALREDKPAKEVVAKCRSIVTKPQRSAKATQATRREDFGVEDQQSANASSSPSTASPRASSPIIMRRSRR